MVRIVFVNSRFYSAHKNEIAGASLFTGTCSKQNR